MKKKYKKTNVAIHKIVKDNVVDCQLIKDKVIFGATKTKVDNVFSNKCRVRESAFLHKTKNNDTLFFNNIKKDALSFN